MGSNGKLQQRLQQLLLRVKQSHLNQCPSPISEFPCFSLPVKDGLVELFTTDDPCIIQFTFCSRDLDFEGFSCIPDDLYESLTASELGEKVLTQIEKVWEEANAILIEVEGTGIWFPLSTVHEIHSNPEDVWKSTVKVDWWIADKKGVAR